MRSKPGAKRRAGRVLVRRVERDLDQRAHVGLDGFVAVQSRGLSVSELPAASCQLRALVSTASRAASSQASPAMSATKPTGRFS